MGYNFFVYDTYGILQEIRMEIMHLDEILRWDFDEEISREREELLEWRDWIFAHLMAPRTKQPVVPPEEEYCGLW